MKNYIFSLFSFAMLLVPAFLHSQVILDVDKAFHDIQQHDIAFLKKKWQNSSEQEQMEIIKRQRKIFLNLFQKIKKSSGFHPNEFNLLAKISCMSPISSPYQLLLLKFISALREQEMTEYFKILTPYLPKLSQEMIQYEIIDGERKYTAHNTSVLQVFMMAELIKLQIIVREPDSSSLLIHSISEMLKKLGYLGVSLNDITIEVKNNNLLFELHSSNPVMSIKLKNKTIVIDIDETPIKYIKK